MAVTDSFVTVPLIDPSGNPKIDNVEVVTGAGVVERQGVTLSDPEVAAARVKVTNALPATNAYGATVRDAAPGYDSGITELTNVLTAVTVDGIRALAILLCNLTTTAKKVTLADGNGQFYLKDYPLQGGMSVTVPLGRASMSGGAQWKADANNAVNAQLIGEK